MDFLSNSVLHFITQYETLLLSMKLYYSHTDWPAFDSFIIPQSPIWPGSAAGRHRCRAARQRGRTAAAPARCRRLAPELR